MAKKQTSILSAIAFGLLLSFLSATASFIANLNENIASTNEQMMQIARGIWIILILVSLVAWIRVFLLWPKSRLALVILFGTGFLCAYSQVNAGLASDVFIGVQKPAYPNSYVLELAGYSAAFTMFSVLFIASLIAGAYRVWSRQKESSGPSKDQA